MRDIQVEIHRLRELVNEIANDKTKLNKIQQLKDDQVYFRQEAANLDKICVEWRLKIRNLTAKLHRVGKFYY